MALNFLNNCRSFDPERRSLSFWGHDNTFEVAFRLDESALCRLTGLKEVGEATAFAVFETNKTHIRDAAARVYRKASTRFCELSAADL